ncbi:MAG: hypothetical protein JSU69_06160, partial [Candidatus Zixiibacteriota bacterium]
MMKISSLLITASLLLILSLHVSAGDRDTGPLGERPVVVEKRARIATEATQSYFDKHKPEKARIWVFFTDKGVFDDRDFRHAAKKIALNEHALKRRAKVGKDRPVFADLPVRQEYVDQIIKRGAQVRRLSRWLNA